MIHAPYAFGKKYVNKRHLLEAATQVQGDFISSTLVFVHFIISAAGVRTRGLWFGGRLPTLPPPLFYIVSMEVLCIT